MLACANFFKRTKSPENSGQHDLDPCGNACWSSVGVPTAKLMGSGFVLIRLVLLVLAFCIQELLFLFCFFASDREKVQAVSPADTASTAASATTSEAALANLSAN